MTLTKISIKFITVQKCAAAIPPIIPTTLVYIIDFSVILSKILSVCFGLYVDFFLVVNFGVRGY